MSKVYSVLGSGIVTAGVFGYISSYGYIPYQLIYFALMVSFIGEIAYLFVKNTKFGKNTLSPANFYLTCSTLGSFFGLILLTAYGQSKTGYAETKSIMMNAFVFTAAIFLSMTLFSFVTVRRTQIYLGCIVASLILSIIGIFVTNSAFSSLLGLFIGVLYVIIDTQIMIFKAENGIYDAFEDARQIFVDLVRIAIHIMVLLSKDNDSKKKKN